MSIMKEVIYRKCNTCNDKYQIYRKNQKFCSHACKSKSVKDLRNPQCRACHKKLINKPRGARYCNHDCYLEGQKNRNGRICKNCGTIFGSQLVIRESFDKKRNKMQPKDVYCSMECTASDNRGQKSIKWKGGTMIHSRSKEVMILIQNSNFTLGFREKYKLRKRLIAEAVLDRKLQTTECVLHLDGNPANDNISNLYICDLSTARKFSNNTIKITKSNLYNYNKGF